MDCFDNLIGVRGICDGNTVSMYLDQCGITSELLADINYTHDDLEALLLTLLGEASGVVASQVKTMKSGSLRIGDTMASNRVGYPYRTRSSVAAKTGYDAGVKIELTRDTDYVKINIDSISLFLDTTGSVNVLVYDLTEGRLLDTIACTATAGQMVYTDVNKTYRAQKRNLALGFLYDSSSASYKTTALENHDCSGCARKDIRQNTYVSVSGVKFADGASKTMDNVKYESDTAGLSVTYTVQCDHEQWLCKGMRQVLLLPVLYYTAYHIAEYGLRSNRLNESTLDLRPVLERIRDNSLMNYNTQIESAMSAMVIPRNNNCFVCRQTSVHRTTL